ncbi:hypothetical protein Pmar_PMAR014251 [Perkinsus marinus ATCC 50983]|uniref:Uncharacterized protein n=1 Tax=Perkinsus marinus (strain ATCC 50983 / TXsc) TaxID=423536 RepID=C5KI81_PERM5|nr:hypothetical protein Pmar_PMAR014251 [Perkinsus marinus ATCC 50983]EER15814.1 hypothetical protein Pmar_PMAR014251 [Perkinsus marinus ATCC 50983]|eukprot:XP_002784018.1 hypothetical protein Pmar_PMAR014251 [Perkinsus marinus ATCC 50983]
MVVVSLEDVGQRTLLECRQSGVLCTKRLCDYVLATVWKDDEVCYADNGVEEADVGTVVERAVALMARDRNPSLETMRLQANFRDMFNHIENVAAA